MTKLLNPITSTGKDFSTSAFWQLKLEIETSADRPDLPLSLSGAELVLDALQNHQDKLYKELEWYRDDWAQQTHSAGKPYPVDDVTRLMEQIKCLNGYINQLATALAADLREIGNAILKPETTA